MSLGANRWFSRWLSNSGWWVADRLVSLSAALIVQIVVVRTIGAEDYGFIAFSLAILALLMPIAQWGSAGLVGRALVACPAEMHSILGAALYLRMVGSALAVIAGCLFWINQPPEGGHAALLTLTITQAALCLQVVEQKYQLSTSGHLLARARILITLGAAVAKGWAAFEFRSVNAVLLVYAIENLAQGLAHIWILKVNSGRWLTPMPKSPWTSWLATRSPWLIASGLAEAVYLKIDLIMLERLASPGELGAYAVAARLSEAWLILPSVLVATGFTRLWERRNPPETWRAELQRWLDFVVAMALVAATAMTLLSGWLIDLLFGAELASAAPILSIHVWAGVFAAMRALVSRWLLIQDLVSVSLMTTVAGAVVNVVLNLWLIPTFGGKGAAISTVIAYATASLLSLLLLDRTRPMAVQMIKALMLPFRWTDVSTHFRSLANRWPRDPGAP